MSTHSQTISIRLPEASRKRLDQAAKLTRRSRSFLMQEALERYLADVVNGEVRGTGKRRLTTLLTLGGAGKRSGAPRSAEEINQHIRWLRDDT